ncbi:hypothetical protein ACF0H5_008444 [Mactra antiquata]
MCLKTRRSFSTTGISLRAAAEGGKAMDRLWTAGCCVVMVVIFMNNVNGRAKNMVAQSVSYSDNDILRSLRTASIMQCGVNCLLNIDCKGFEIENVNSTCVLFKNPIKLTENSDKIQYIDHAACDEGWTKGVTSCYFVTLVSISAPECNTLCHSYGGYVVTDTSAEETAFILQLSGGGTFWVGGVKTSGGDLDDGTWEWLNGETWDYTNWADRHQ